MSCSTLNLILVLFFYFMRCSINSDLDLCQKLSQTKPHSKISFQEGFLNYKVYFINLYSGNEEELTKNSYLRKNVDSENILCRFYLEMYNENHIHNLVEKLKSEEKFHFKFFLGKIEEKECRKFLKYFSQKLEEKKIYDFHLFYSTNNGFRYFCELNTLHFYIQSNSFVTVFQYNDANKTIQTEKRIISDDILKYLMIKHIKMVQLNQVDYESVKCFRNYFLNYKLFSFSEEYFTNNEVSTKDSNLRVFHCYAEEKIKKLRMKDPSQEDSVVNFPDIKYLKTLFHFSQDSAFLKTMVVQYVLNINLKDFDIFKEILEDLKIYPTEENVSQHQTTNESSSFFKKDINNLNPNLIYEKIRRMNIEDDTSIYRKLSILFYIYMKTNYPLELEKRLKVIETIIFKNYFEKFTDEILINLTNIMAQVYKYKPLSTINDGFHGQRKILLKNLRTKIH